MGLDSTIIFTSHDRDGDMTRNEIQSKSNVLEFATWSQGRANLSNSHRSQS